MKYPLAAAAIVALAAAFTPATAEDRPVTKAPQKTMGDEGKLPPTSTMSDSVPDMTGPATATGGQGAGDGTAPGATPRKRMGDEGKLPATSTMSKEVPAMTPKSDK
jgi:hypothetical protein